MGLDVGVVRRGILRRWLGLCHDWRRLDAAVGLWDDDLRSGWAVTVRHNRKSAHPIDLGNPLRWCDIHTAATDDRQYSTGRVDAVNRCCRDPVNTEDRSTMTNLLSQMVVAVVGTLSMLTVAPTLHEAAHAVTAHLVGGEVVDVGARPGWRGLFVDFRAPSELRARVVGAAPMLSGSALGMLWLVIVGLPSFGVLSVVAVGNWLIYTFSGGMADLSMRKAEQTAGSY